MNRRIKILIFAVCIVLALGITLYPLISNVVGEKYRSIVESRYDKAVEKLNTMELIAEKEEAVLYNRTLQGGTENAFSREALAEAEESYGRLLNVRGDGIKVTSRFRRSAWSCPFTMAPPRRRWIRASGTCSAHPCRSAASVRIAS